MLKVAKNYTDKVLNSFGFTITRIDQNGKLADLRTITTDPVEAYYLAKGKPFLLNVPIEQCTSIEFSCANKHNPFVQTLINYSKGLCTTYQGSPLQHFYNSWHPGTSQQYFKEGKELAPPWDLGFKKEINLAEARLNRNDFVEAQRELGFSKSNIYGHINRGPVSEAFGQITFNRFVKIYNSVKERGYLPEKIKSGHIKGAVFIKAGDYRVTISSGKHRITALQALGYTHIPVQFGPPRFPVLVRREDAEQWPNVKAGYYTREEALQVFDSKFKLEHPSGWYLSD
jgi:hypothetical protein